MSMEVEPAMECGHMHLLNVTENLYFVELHAESPNSLHALAVPCCIVAMQLDLCRVDC
jgi:hypothetical protein